MKTYWVIEIYRDSENGEEVYNKREVYSNFEAAKDHLMYLYHEWKKSPAYTMHDLDIHDAEEYASFKYTYEQPGLMVTGYVGIREGHIRDHFIPKDRG